MFFITLVAVDEVALQSHLNVVAKSSVSLYFFDLFSSFPDHCSLILFSSVIIIRQREQRFFDVKICDVLFERCALMMTFLFTPGKSKENVAATEVLCHKRQIYNTDIEMSHKSDYLYCIHSSWKDFFCLVKHPLVSCVSPDLFLVQLVELEFKQTHCAVQSFSSQMYGDEI